jgi:hypothetical protein
VVREAEDFQFPGAPLLVCLYNPFPAAVLERVVANLETSLGERPKRVAIVYVNPHALAAIARCELFERVPTIADWMPAPAQRLRPHERAVVFVTRPA